MEQQVFKQEVLDEIKKAPMLYGKICAELDISPASLPRLIYSNDKRLTQINVLRILCEHFKIEDQNELFEKIRETNLV